MGLILLTIGVASLILQVRSAHVALLVLSTLAALWAARGLIRKRPLTALFIAMYVAMYYPNPLAVMLGWVPLEYGTTEGILLRSNAMLMIGLGLFVIGASIPFHRKYINRMPQWRLNPVLSDAVIAGIVAIGILSTLILVTAVAAMGIDIYTVDKSWRASYGAHNAVFSLCEFSLMLLPLAAFLITLKPLPVQPVYWVIVGGLLVVVFVIFRNRTDPLMVLMAIVVGVALRGKMSMEARPGRRRFPTYVKVLIVLSIPTLVVLAVAGKYLRTAQANRDYRLTREQLEHLIEHTFTGGDLGYSIFFRRGMALYPSRHSFYNGRSYYRLLFVPIPRAIWPGKPENSARTFARALDPELGRRNVTIPPGIVCDLYINFGHVGVVGMIVFGLLMTLERYRGLTSVLLLAGSGDWLFHLVRGELTNPAVQLVYVLFFAWLCTRIIRPTMVSPRVVAQAATRALPGRRVVAQGVQP